MYVVLTTGPGYNTHGVEKIAKCAKKITIKIVKKFVQKL